MIKTTNHFSSGKTVKLQKIKVDAEIYNTYSELLSCFGLGSNVIASMIECMMHNTVVAFLKKYPPQPNDDHIDLTQIITIFNDMFPYAQSNIEIEKPSSASSCSCGNCGVKSSSIFHHNQSNHTN